MAQCLSLAGNAERPGHIYVWPLVSGASRSVTQFRDRDLEVL